MTACAARLRGRDWVGSAGAAEPVRRHAARGARSAWGAAHRSSGRRARGHRRDARSRGVAAERDGPSDPLHGDRRHRPGRRSHERVSDARAARAPAARELPRARPRAKPAGGVLERLRRAASRARAGRARGERQAVTTAPTLREQHLRPRQGRYAVDLRGRRAEPGRDVRPHRGSYSGPPASTRRPSPSTKPRGTWPRERPRATSPSSSSS